MDSGTLSTRSSWTQSNHISPWWAVKLRQEHRGVCGTASNCPEQQACDVPPSCVKGAKSLKHRETIRSYMTLLQPHVTVTAPLGCADSAAEDSTYEQ